MAQFLIGVYLGGAVGAYAEATGTQREAAMAALKWPVSAFRALRSKF